VTKLICVFFLGNNQPSKIYSYRKNYINTLLEDKFEQKNHRNINYNNSFEVNTIVHILDMFQLMIEGPKQWCNSNYIGLCV